MVAVPGLEPRTRAYEARDLPLVHTASESQSYALRFTVVKGKFLQLSVSALRKLFGVLPELPGDVFEECRDGHHIDGV